MKTIRTGSQRNHYGGLTASDLFEKVGTDPTMDIAMHRDPSPIPTMASVTKKVAILRQNRAMFVGRAAKPEKDTDDE